jgi:RHS repeat-associated protein
VNDLLGRPTSTQLADSRLLGTGYDGDSNVTSVTLPSTEVHDFGYSAVDLLTSYTPPSLGSASPATSYTYDVDRELTNLLRPDGVSVTYGYDSAGRPLTTTYPQGALTRTYSPTTGLLATLVAASGETTTYGYDGFLKTATTWSGPVAGALTLGFDKNFRMTSQTVNGTALAFGYDGDGLLTGAGALTLSLSSQNGQLTGTTLGSVTDAYTYDAYGLFATYVASFSGTTLYSESVQRDANGRITQKTETIGSTQHAWGYTYDVNGRLTDVTEDGGFHSHYGYDADDNRTTYTNTAGSVNPTYDAQDRLLTYGSNTYQYTADGELTTKTTGTGMTQYAYDALGNLLSVSLPSGEDIAYVVDGENRRVGKEVNGTLTTGFLYKDALNVVVQLDGSGNVVARFVFGSKANVPDYFTANAGTFRILSDHLGSPRLIVNASTGAVVEEIDYDEFGNVTNDTAPGTIPFGFAGGLYDGDTGLVRFGARDFDASVGRWTSKDPLRFGGGSMNLYGYVVNDPIDLNDSSGKGPGCDLANNTCSAYSPTSGAGCQCGCAATHVCAVEQCGGTYTCQVTSPGHFQCHYVGGGDPNCIATANNAASTCSGGCNRNCSTE